MAETKQQRYLKLLTALKSERSSFESHWRDIANFIKPRRLRLTRSDVNKGDKRNQNIVDSTATQAAATLRAGLLSGMTSPARPWFGLGTMDTDLAKYGPVKNWLEDCRVIMANALGRSNFYNAAPLLYGDMGVFGTGCLGMMDDDKDVFRFTPFPLGEYWIANDHKLRVRTFVREFQMTVRQLVAQFGTMRSGQPDWSNFSTHVRSAWERGNYETWIGVCHVIQENADHDVRYLAAKYKAFTDCYFEVGRDQGTDTFLSEKGFDEFPIMAGRWEVAAGDVYGTECPGMVALGDVKALQHGEKRGAQALDQMVVPALLAPSSYRATKISLLPGEVSYGDQTDQIRPVVDTSHYRPDLLEQKQEQKRELINDAFYVRLFSLISNMDPKDVVAAAIYEMKEEKSLLLGPLLGQAEQDVLKPIIDREFAMLYRAGRLPDAPPELHGQELTVEFTSIMAEAQKAVGRSGMDAFAAFALNMVKFVPDAIDKLDTDTMLEGYGDATSIPSRWLREEDQVKALRDQRQQASQAAQANMNADTMAKGSTAAKNLAQAPLAGNTALSALVGSGAGAIGTLPGGS